MNKKKLSQEVIDVAIARNRLVIKMLGFFYVEGCNETFLLVARAEKNLKKANALFKKHLNGGKK